jgi:hypothetical protein
VFWEHAEDSRDRVDDVDGDRVQDVRMQIEDEGQLMESLADAIVRNVTRKLREKLAERGDPEMVLGQRTPGALGLAKDAVASLVR